MEEWIEMIPNVANGYDRNELGNWKKRKKGKKTDRLRTDTQKDE